MPRLARLRIVSLGHADARMPDLTLNFCDREGRAVDSTLWLRNGGGKSSVLNLFFALVRPDRREFLGGKAEGKQRHLEHYVLPNDRGVTAAEWDLGGTDRYLTGVFYEWQESNLRRFYFAARSSDALSIETLPLHVEGAEGRKSRRTLAGFRSEWQALRNRLPHQQVVSTENQTEWKAILEAAQIDHELFSYQIKMNEREGGADTLFRFKDPEDFVDFLLRLVMDPSYADKVGENLTTFREELLERKARHLPERELCRGLAEKLRSLSEVAAARRELDAERARLTGRKEGLKRLLDSRLTRIESESALLKERIIEERKAVDEANGAAQELRIRAAALRRHTRRTTLREAELKLDALKERDKAAIRHAAFLDAARPLLQALRYEQTVRELQEEIEKRREEHRPLREELGKAAAEYGAALLYQKQGLEDRGRLAAAREGEERGRAAEDRAKASLCDREFGRVQADLKNVERSLEEARRARSRLEAEGILHAGETAGDARRRFEKVIAEQRGIIERSEVEVARITGELETIRLEIGRASSEESACRSEEKDGARRLAAELEEKARLEARPVLRKHLETDTVDLDRLDEAVLLRLDAARQRLVEEFASLRAETAEDERAAASLESRGLLPASPDVERLLDVLKGSIRGAWPGWTAVESNLPPDKRRVFVEMRPGVATGVVVRDDQIDKAIERIRDSGVIPEQPVIVAPQSALQSARDSREGFVVGPASDALFDKAAGAQELARRQVRLDERRSKLSARGSELSDFSDALACVRQFRQKHPAGWARAEAERLENLRRRSESLAERRRDLEARAKDLNRVQAHEEERRQTAQEAIHGAQLRQVRLDDFHTVHEVFAQEREGRRLEFIVRLGEIEAQRKSLLASADGHEYAAGEAAAEKGQAAVDAARVGSELSRVAYLPEGFKPLAGAVDVLGDRYELLKAEYEGKLGEEGLRQRLVENQKVAADHRKRFVRMNQREDDVRQAMAEVKDADELDDAFADAQNTRMTLMGQVGNLTKEVEVLTKERDEIEKVCAELGGVPELNEIPDRPAEEAERCDREAAAQTTAASLAGKRAQEALETAKDRERDAAIVSRDRQQLSALEQNNADLFMGSGATEEVLLPSGGSVADLLGELAGALGRARESQKDLDRRRTEAVRGMRKWVEEPKFKVLDATLARRLLLIDEPALEAQSATYAGELELRAKTIDDQLARIETHRELVIGELQQATEDALALLRSASNQSRLPESVPGLAGKQFLRINLNVPSDPAQRRAKLAELMDEIVEQKLVPSGLDLVQRSVRRVARPVTVRILHPDPDYPRETVEITETALFSGGEQLTSAILLYCTLAQLRLKRRGTLDRPSSVLILDNPIGKSSRVRFLELQREVARGMGVQLVYTTAVNDLDALATLPNVIRLRNERQDRNTGQRVIEHEAGLEGVRIVLPENSPADVPST